jgi:phosphocarrier protein
LIKQPITIINKLGLHARAAAKFVTLASKFSSEIQLERGTRSVNGKSIMAVMLLAASKGTELNIIITGDDEQEAADALTALINNRFDEGE